MPVQTTNENQTIIYEQPVGESMQIYLRLEYLFDQFDQALDNNSSLAISFVVKILEVIKRPDLKSKITQTLTQYATTLSQLEHFPQVSTSRLKNVLDKLDRLITPLNHHKNRIGERLRDNDFLNQLRLQQASPGGNCLYTNPALALWLSQSPRARLEDLEYWISELYELREIVDLMLYLIRNSSPVKTITSHNGFYHQNLDPILPCGIVRVGVPAPLNVFPEFSLGRHRLSLRFLVPNYRDDGKPKPLNAAIEFELSCCRI